MALSNTQIRSEGSDLVNASPGGRVNVLFSDGRVGCVLQENYTNLRFYWQDTTGSDTWHSVSIGAHNPQYLAATIDDSDNVHICFRAGNDPNQVKYCILEDNGDTTFTLWGVDTVFNAGPWTVDALAIDVLGTGSGVPGGTGVPIIVGHVTEGSGDGKLIYTVRRSSDDTWVTPLEKTLDNSTSGSVGSQVEPLICSVARDNAGLSGSNSKFVAAITARKNSKCAILGITVDTSTGAEVNSKTIIADVLSASRGHRIGEVFSSGSGEWIFGGLFYDPSGRMNKVIARFDWNALLFPVRTHLLSTSASYSFVSTTFSGVTYRWWMGGIQYTNGKIVFIWQQNGTSGRYYIWHHIAEVSSDVTWGGDTQASFHTVPLMGLHGGGPNRNANLKRIIAYSVLLSGGSTFLKWGFWNLPPLTAEALVKPVDGSTVNTDIPIFQTVIDGYDLALGGGTRFKPIYEVASASNFLTDYRTFEPPDSAKVITGTTEMAVPAIYELDQRTWYGRQKFEDEFGQEGPAGPTSDFVVSHPPSTSSHIPTGNTPVDAAAPRMDWNFFDTSPTDFQTAYQVVIERNDTLASVVDSGKVTSDDTFYDPTISGTLNGISLRWKVRVWDSDDVVGSYSGYNTFTLYEAPSVVIDAVESATPAPLVEWSFTAGTSPSQNSYRVSFKRNSDNKVVLDTAWTASANEFHQVVGAILERDVTYTVTVRVRDTAGIEASDTYVYTPDWTGAPQPTFSVNPSRFESEGFIKVTWSGAEAGTFLGWRVYRRPVGGEWERIAHVTGSPLNIIDFLASPNTQTEYTVVQVTDLDGAEVESEYTLTQIVTPYSSHYWLIDGDESGISEEAYILIDQHVSTVLAHVVDDTFTEEYEEETHHIIGRGVRREVGTRWGFSGELRAQLRGLSSLDPREERLRLEYLRSTGKEVFLRNPFGDLWLTALGSLKYKRVSGVGVSEFTEVNLPYQEVH